MKSVLILLGLLAVGSGVAAEFRDAVVPNSLENVEGAAGSSFPFDLNEGRMQQVYSAAELGATPGLGDAVSGLFASSANATVAHRARWG